MTDQAECLREMAARFRRTVVTAPGCRVLAVTSGKGGVGETSLAVNLGLALVDQGHRVTLVDADLGAWPRAWTAVGRRAARVPLPDG